MTRIFIDVGAHYGETLAAALDPVWGFDRVICLEPSSACYRVLKRIKDSRVTVDIVALSNRTGTATLYGTGLLGGSLYAEKRQLTDEIKTETINLVQASEWLRFLPDGEIYLKMNCEGSEVDILDDLLDTGAISRITSIFVDFDIRKVSGQAGRQAVVERRLTEAGVRYTSAGGQAALRDWLERDCPKVSAPFAKRIAHRLRLYEPAYDRAVELAGKILPKNLFWWIGKRFGRMARG